MTEEISQFHGEIRDLMRRRPFMPFAIVKKNGERYEIASRNELALNEYVVVVVPTIGRKASFRLSQVARLEMHEPAA